MNYSRYLSSIGDEMQQAALPHEFISSAIDFASQYEGIADLIILWHEEKSYDERKEIIADIQELLDDCSIDNKQEFNSSLINNIIQLETQLHLLKEKLEGLIQNQGGISELSRKTSIPSEYLNRLLTTNCIPRRPSLLKIARALQIEEDSVDLFWKKLSDNHSRSI